jgi:23S rRNA pseudouridine1911/1915/1917 synthase
MPKKWTVEEQDHGARMDVFLANQLPDLTRSQIAKRLKQESGRVNGKIASVHQFLKTGDVVEFDERKKTVEGKIVVKLPPPELVILKETPEWIVLDKPAGVVVHPDTNNESGTLVDALLPYAPQMAKVGEDPNRPGIVHRLDKEVSGLMVVAKTQAAFEHLKKQFAEHTVDKKYLALVYGEVGPDEGDIKFRIARSTTKGRMAARPTHEEGGKAAWTHYKTLRRFRHASLLELEIFSGRTHQIRAHMLAFSHPVIGDPLYTRRAEGRSTIAPRLMLQSIHLSFIDPATGETQTFDLPPVPAFDQVIRELDSSS